MSIFKKYIEPYNKELSELLESDLSIETKLHFLKATMNNVSKNFSKVLNNSCVKDRQVYDTKDGLFSLVITTDMSKLQCRQFYEDLIGFYCYNIFTDTMYKVVDPEVSEGHGTNCGTGNEKISAYSAKASYQDATQLTLETFENEIYA